MSKNEHQLDDRLEELRAEVRESYKPKKKPKTPHGTLIPRYGRFPSSPLDMAGIIGLHILVGILLYQWLTG